MTTDGDMFCQTDCGCGDADELEALELGLWRAALGYLLLGGAILGGLVLLAWVANGR